MELCVCHVRVVELVDTLGLGPNSFRLGVQVPSLIHTYTGNEKFLVTFALEFCAFQVTF